MKVLDANNYSKNQYKIKNLHLVQLKKEVYMLYVIIGFYNRNRLYILVSFSTKSRIIL